VAPGGRRQRAVRRALLAAAGLAVLAAALHGTAAHVTVAVAALLVAAVLGLHGSWTATGTPAPADDAVEPEQQPDDELTARLRTLAEAADAQVARAMAEGRVGLARELFDAHVDAALTLMTERAPRAAGPDHSRPEDPR
jgi:hypothetical protein